MRLLSFINEIKKNLLGTNLLWRVSYGPLLQWDILCDDAKKYVPLTKTIFYAGKLFGAYFFGWVSDRFGRRTTFLITMLVQFIASLIESFSTNFIMYVILRVPLGVCSGGEDYWTTGTHYQGFCGQLFDEGEVNIIHLTYGPKENKTN